MKRREGVEVSIYELGVGGQKNVQRVEEHAARWRETFVNYLILHIQVYKKAIIHMFIYLGFLGKRVSKLFLLGKGVPSYEF